MKVVIDDNLLSKKEIAYINNTILSSNFPWYFTKEANKGDNYWFYSHCVIRRIELGGENVSYVSDFCLNLLDKFCKKHNIKYKKILRCSINSNFNQKNKSALHTDHKTNYKHLLIYLTQNKGGETILFKKDKKTISQIIKPKKFRAVNFPKCWHIGSSPEEGRRVVLVYTFK